MEQQQWEPKAVNRLGDRAGGEIRSLSALCQRRHQSGKDALTKSRSIDLYRIARAREFVRYSLVAS